MRKPSQRCDFAAFLNCVVAGQCPTGHLPRARRPTKIVFDKVLGPVPIKMVKFKPKFKPDIKPGFSCQCELLTQVNKMILSVYNEIQL